MDRYSINLDIAVIVTQVFKKCLPPRRICREEVTTAEHLGSWIRGLDDPVHLGISVGRDSYHLGLQVIVVCRCRRSLRPPTRPDRRWRRGSRRSRRRCWRRRECARWRRCGVGRQGGNGRQGGAVCHLAQNPAALLETVSRCGRRALIVQVRWREVGFVEDQPNASRILRYSRR